MEQQDVVRKVKQELLRSFIDIAVIEMLKINEAAILERLLGMWRATVSLVKTDEMPIELWEAVLESVEGDLRKLLQLKGK